MTAVRMYPVEIDRPGPRLHPGRDLVAPLPRSRPYARRRLIAAMTATIMTIAIVVGLTQLSTRIVAAVSASHGGVHPRSTVADDVGAPPFSAGASRGYVVRPGDTLWAIARRIQPSGDVRPLVEELSRRNGGPAIQAGQVMYLDDLVDR